VLCPRKPESGGSSDWTQAHLRHRQLSGGIHVLCHSPEREAKEAAITAQQRSNFEAKALADSLSRPRRNRKADSVHRRIGRLQQAYPTVARHYDIRVKLSADGPPDPLLLHHGARRNPSPEQTAADDSTQGLYQATDIRSVGTGREVTNARNANATVASGDVKLAERESAAGESSAV
jgi:hypothetical protein